MVAHRAPPMCGGWGVGVGGVGGVSWCFVESLFGGWVLGGCVICWICEALCLRLVWMVGGVCLGIE